LSKRIKHIIYLLFLYFWVGQLYAQIQVDKQHLVLTFDSIGKHIEIKQNISFTNTYTHRLDSLVWLNWANAYSSKRSALARHIIENYNLNFHFASAKNYGWVNIKAIQPDDEILDFYPLKSDVYIMKLKHGLQPGQQITLQFTYRIQLPHSKFTGFGKDKRGNILLKNFYFQIPPLQQTYSEKGIDDYPALPQKFDIEIRNLPKGKSIYTDLNLSNNRLSGIRKNFKILLTGKAYQKFQLKNINITIPQNNDLSIRYQVERLQRILDFMQQTAGNIDFSNILLTDADYKNRKVYGLDLLPEFLNPYPKGFKWEMANLHQISIEYFKEMQIDNRKYPWIANGLAAFMEYEYLKHYYPDQKLLGKLADYKLVRFYYASQVKITEKYPWLYLYVARMEKDQALRTALDSLTNFNRSVMMPFKAALGLKMLNDEQLDTVFYPKLQSFIKKAQNESISDKDFDSLVVAKNQKKWWKSYVQTTQKYDYKIKKLHQKGNRLYLKIKNKTGNLLPLQVYIKQKDSLVLKKQVKAFTGDTILQLKTGKVQFAGINYYNDYPELQNKNNYKRPGFHLLNKPIQIRPYQDFDNPLKTQIFINPFFEYNYYDGIIAGGQIFNESVLHNRFIYVITPGFGTKNHSLTGSFSLSNTHYFENKPFYAINYGFGFKYFHYNHNLVYRKYNPHISFKFRDSYLRKRKGGEVNLQYMLIDKDPVGIKPNETEHYGVFDLSYTRHNVNIIKDLFFKADVQFASHFGKISTMLRYRFLTDKNRQWDFRIFAGKFLYNHTTTDYFSFALDRPTDYLFQYHYYGRSETTGIFHQQFVWAEGGFKTFFDRQFANDFLISNNINMGIWKWFNLYGDAAWLKQKNIPVTFYYDSGVRINLVQDYFEVFFPVYSKKGWEIKQPEYLSKIRIIFTMDINGLFKMFKRGWY